MTNAEPLEAQNQYCTTDSQDARAQLHARFSANSRGWFRWVFDHFDLPPAAHILEIGCGSGSLWKENAERIPADWNVTLSDSAPGMLQEARRNLQGAGHEFSYALINAETIPMDGSQLDAVIANHVLYHVPDRARAISEIHRVLRPGGRLYAATSGAYHMREMSELVSRVGIEVFTEHTVFTLETGAEELSACFSDIAVDRYPDYLGVTEAEPLIDYLLSMRIGPWLDEDHLREIREIAEREIADRGAFRITKSSGLFTARKTQEGC